MKDLDGHCTVLLGPEGPEAAMGCSADHVLLGVVVAYTGSGLSHFLSAWASPIFRWVSLLNQ